MKEEDEEYEEEKSLKHIATINRRGLRGRIARIEA